MAAILSNSVRLCILLKRKRGTAASSISSMISRETRERGMAMAESARVLIARALADVRLVQSSLWSASGRPTRYHAGSRCCRRVYSS